VRIAEFALKHKDAPSPTKNILLDYINYSSRYGIEVIKLKSVGTGNLLLLVTRNTNWLT